jgi:hypothetical protein
LKHPAKLEADQDLRPENEHARLIERDLELLGNLHVILQPQEATDDSRYRRWEANQPLSSRIIAPCLPIKTR